MVASTHAQLTDPHKHGRENLIKIKQGLAHASKELFLLKQIMVVEFMFASVRPAGVLSPWLNSMGAYASNF